MNTTAQATAPAPSASVSHGLQDQFFVSGSDIFALGHYPGNPIYPGVLIADRLCCLAEALASRELGQSAAVGVIKRIQYLDAVLPGDRVRIDATVKRVIPEGIEIAASARVGNRQTTRATLLCSAGVRTMAVANEAPLAEPGARAMSHRRIAQVLPHRYPFLLIDSIDDFIPGATITARKVINRGSPLFLNQMPTSYPHGLVIESIGQAGIALFFLSRESSEPGDIVLGSIVDTTLCRSVPFDAVLTVEARIERMLANGVVFSGEARIGDQVVTRVGSLVAMMDPR